MIPTRRNEWEGFVLGSVRKEGQLPLGHAGQSLKENVFIKQDRRVEMGVK